MCIVIEIDCGMTKLAGNSKKFGSVKTQDKKKFGYHSLKLISISLIIENCITAYLSKQEWCMKNIVAYAIHKLNFLNKPSVYQIKALILYPTISV